MQRFFLMAVCVLAASLGHAEELTLSKDPVGGLPLFGETPLRAAWVFSVADLKLYAEPGLRKEEVLSGAPLALSVTYARSVKASTLIRLAEKTLTDQFGNEVMLQFSEPLKGIHEAYRDVNAGDTYVLRALPDEGLSLFLNNELLIHIPDIAFARFYLNIWLGNHSRAETILKGLFRTTG